MVNLNFVISRIEELKGIKNSKELAALLDISAQDLSNRKKRGTLLPVIFEWAIHENVNLGWLFNQNSNHAVTVEDSMLSYKQQQLVDPQTLEMISIMSDLDKESKAEVLKHAREKLELRALREVSRAKSELIDALEPITTEQQRKLNNGSAPVVEKPKKKKVVSIIKSKKDSP